MHTYIYTYIERDTQSLPTICKVYMNHACIPLQGANLVFSMLKNGAFFWGTAKILLLASSAAPPGCQVRCGTAVSTLCVLTARARCPGAVCLHRLAHTRASTHTRGHRGATSCFSAFSVCLLGLRVVCMELSPLKLPCNHLSVEAPQQRRSGKTDRGLLDVFWVWVCILQLLGKCTKAAQIHRGSKNIMLGTSCLHPSLVQAHATLKYRKILTTVVVG